jgi:hypothetical protein
MATPVPNLFHALNTVADEDGFVPFSVARFAATAAAVDISFDYEYGSLNNIRSIVGDSVGIDAKEFAEWMEKVTTK